MDIRYLYKPEDSYETKGCEKYQKALNVVNNLLQELGLSEADIESWYGKLFLVKAGGEVIESQTTLSEDIKLLPSQVALAYGGKNAISKAMPSGYKPKFTTDGLRVTDELAMKPFLGAVLKIGEKLAEELSAELILPSVYAVKKFHPSGDMGYVGEPTRPLDKVGKALSKKKTVLLAPVGKAYSGEGYLGQWNSNADAVAGVSAVYLCPDELVFLTDVDGIKVDGAVQHYLSVTEAVEAMDKGYIAGGMHQKILYALMPLFEGVLNHAHITNGLKPHALLHALVHTPFTGTVIYR